LNDQEQSATGTATALGLDFTNLLPTILMHNHWPSRGRRKTVEQFTVREGVWILGIVGVILMAITLLFLFGYLNADQH
jgi:hypothetical protein